MILVGENNVGKSNILEALTIFNDADVKLCSEEDCFKAHEKDSLLSLEEETILDHKITDFSCVDLKIQTKEVSERLKELSKILISYPFCVFIGGFINLIMSYGVLDSFLKSYKEKLKLSAFSTRQANNLFFKKLIKHLSGNNQLIKVFCQCISKEIDEKYPINENFKQQFRTFRSNIISLKKRIKNSLKDLEKTRKDFKRKKESWIKEIENDCKNQKTLDPNYDLLLDNIQQICEKYITSHVVSDESKDMKYIMCQFYLKQIDLLFNSEIKQYRYSNFFESARISLWESIKTLDETSNARLFPKNIGEIKDKFETNKEKFKQSKNYSELVEHCRECNPYTAFQNLKNKVQFPLSGGSSHQFDELVPTMKEYKEPKITDNDLKTALFTRIDYSSPSEFNQSDWFFRNSLFRKIGFHPNTIGILLGTF